MSKKRLFFGFFLLCVLMCIGVYIAYHTPGSSAQVTIDALSDRAKEFVENERKKSGSSWNATAFEVTDERRHDLSPKTIETSCVTIHFPYLSKNEHVSDEPEKCRVELRMDSPPARVIIATELQKENLNETSGVLLRKKFTNDYHFVETSFEFWPESLLYYQKDGAVLFLKNGELLITIGITEMIDPSRLTADIIKQIVDGLELKKIE